MGSWEALAFVGLYVAAIMLAIDTGVRLMPDLRRYLGGVTEKAWWGLTPFVLLTLSGVIFLFHAIQPA